MRVEERLYPWLSEPWNVLRGYIKQQRMPHGLLITGGHGVGKENLAKAFSHALLCQAPLTSGLNCGQCSSCHLLKAGTHPDLSCTYPLEDKTTISINQIRSIIVNTQLKPQFDRFRVIIFKPAEAMTIAAANAFLKCLEEPGERTLFILLSANPGKLPATIVSRCQQLALKFPCTEALAKWLQQQSYKVADSYLNSAELIKHGLISIEQLNENDCLEQRRLCHQDWLAVARHEKFPGVVSEHWLQVSSHILLLWLLSWTCDLIKIKINRRYSNLMNPDFAQTLQDCGERLELPKLFQFYDLLIERYRQADKQVNTQLLFEDILVNWQLLNGRG